MILSSVTFIPQDVDYWKFENGVKCFNPDFSPLKSDFEY